MVIASLIGAALITGILWHTGLGVLLSTGLGTSGRGRVQGILTSVEFSNRSIQGREAMHVRLGVGVLFASACYSGAVYANGEIVSRPCSTENISVLSQSPENLSRVCSVAAALNPRLRNLGLGLTRNVTIEITEEFEVPNGACVALYSTNARKLQVLPIDCLEDLSDRATAFPEMDPELLFKSLIVHELVHAYLDQHESSGDLSRVAHEYLAYAIQLDELPREERADVLARAGVQQEVTDEDFSETLLNMAPVIFAARAWSHFVEQGGDPYLVSRILKGEILAGELPE